MKTLMVMTRGFELLGEIPQFEFLQYTRGYYDVGDFSLKINPGASNADKLMQGVILFPPDAPHKMMLVEDYAIDDNGVVVSGCQLKGDTRKRLCVPPLSLPTTLYQWNGTKWATIADEKAILNLMQGDVYEGYAFPDAPFVGMVYVDMSALASVYNWAAGTQTGETWLDLGVARLRSKYKNFGWDSYIGPAESAVKHFVRNNLTAPEDTKRVMPGWTMTDDLGRGLSLPWRARFDRLDEFLRTIGEATGVGYDLTPDFKNKIFRLDVLIGRDFSQGANQVVVSTDMGNAEMVTFQQTRTNTYTTAYAGGAGEDEERLILAIGSDQAGELRREMWVDAGSVDDADDLTLNAQNKLNDAAPAETLTAKVIDTGACRYERDWNVGDVVWVRRRGAFKASRILSVMESYERDKPRQLDVVFGAGKITVTDVLRRSRSTVR